MRRVTGLANYYRGYAEVATQLTALRSPPERFLWTPAAQASLDSLMLALSSVPVLRTFDPASFAVLTTDASTVDVAVTLTLTQPDKAGQQHPVAYESRNPWCTGVAALCAGCAVSRRAAALALAHVNGGCCMLANVVQQPPIDLEGAQAPPHPKGGVTLNPSCTGMYNAIARSELLLGTGTATAPPQPAPSDDFSLPPAIVPPSTRAHAGRAGTPLRSTAARVGSTIPCRCPSRRGGMVGRVRLAAVGGGRVRSDPRLFGGQAHAVPRAQRLR